MAVVRQGESRLNNETEAVVSLQVVKFAATVLVFDLGDVTGCCGAMLTVEAKKLSWSL